MVRRVSSVLWACDTLASDMRADAPEDDRLEGRGEDQWGLQQAVGVRAQAP